MKKTISLLVLIFCIIAVPINKLQATNSITERLKGRLLLQVEQKGAIWYVSPTDSKRYQVTFANALDLFENLALGITNADLVKIPANFKSIKPDLDTDNDGYKNRVELEYNYSPYIPGNGKGKFTIDNNLANRLKGRLLLQVEQKGAIWYVDHTGTRHNVRWDNLMDLFRGLALGITDANLAMISSEQSSAPAIIKKISCTTNWQCGAWLPCVNNLQTRNCTDINGCGTNINKPTIQKNCSTDNPITKMETTELLVFISPQYANDNLIQSAVNNYLTAVKQDINWNSRIISLNNTTNSIGKIREVIKNDYNNGLKAALMIGEDIKTALNSESGSQDAPSVVPWQELNQDISYAKFPLSDTTDITFHTISHNATAIELDNILSPPVGTSVILGNVRTYQAEIFTSLLYPVNSDPYATKQAKIIKALNKFASNRKVSYGNEIEVFEDSASHEGLDWDSFSKLGNIHYTKNCGNCMVNENNQYKLFMARGHALPSLIQVGRNMMASEVKNINTPFFTANGCYVKGWVTSIDEPDGRLNLPNRTLEIFMEQIFDSNHLRIMMLGTEGDVTNFAKFVDALNNGKTIAEAYTLDNNPMSSVFYGDPTFRFHK